MDRPGQIGAGAQNLWGAPNFQARMFCHVKKKRILDLTISSQIDKTMKKLHWIPNTTVNTIVPVTFRLCLHIRLLINCFH